MHIRLIVRNYATIVITEGGTQEARRAWWWTSRFTFVGGSDRQIRRVATLRDAGESRKAQQVAEATLPRKASREIVGYPYRTPTQVGEENILRRE